MGEMADWHFESDLGDFCERCGELMDESEEWLPRMCDECASDDEEE